MFYKQLEQSDQREADENQHPKLNINRTSFKLQLRSPFPIKYHLRSFILYGAFYLIILLLTFTVVYVNPIKYVEELWNVPFEAIYNQLPVTYSSAQPRYRRHSVDPFSLYFNRKNDTPFLPYDSLFLNSSYLAKNLYFRKLTDAPNPKINVADLYGGIFDYAYYFTSILVGTPPQRQSVILDTGSSLLGFPCSTCSNCGHHIDNRFDFRASSTAEWIRCSDVRCRSQRCFMRTAEQENTCSYEQSYTEGSSIAGYYFSDIVALGEISQGNTAVRFDYIGCHEKETKLFSTQKASGIMGVSFPKQGKQDTIIDAFFRTSAPQNKVFSICVSEEGGRLTIGGYNSSLHRKSRTLSSSNLRLLNTAQRISLDVNNKGGGQMIERHLKEVNVIGTDDGNSSEKDFVLNVVDQLHGDNHANDDDLIAWTRITSNLKYEIGILSVSVIENPKEAPATIQQIGTESQFGPCIVDSGTTFSYFSPQIYNQIMKVLERVSQSTTAGSMYQSTNSDELCWRIDSIQDFEKLPVFLFYLRGGGVVEWNSYSYLHRKGKTSVWCVAFDDNRQQQTILGMSFMKQKDVIFDREKNLIGFAEAACPTVSDSMRPPPPRYNEKQLALEQSFSNMNGLSHGNNVLITSSPSPIDLNAVSAPFYEFVTAFTTMKSSIGEEESARRETIVWASAGILVGGLVVTMGAMAAKSMRNRGQIYEPMRPGGVQEYEDIELQQPSHLPFENNSLPIITTVGRTSLTPNEHEITGQEEDISSNEQFEVIEAELDELERTTNSPN